MPSKEWRKKNPEKQKALAKTARKRRWERIRNDPDLKAKANARVRAWYSVPENKAKQIARQGRKWRDDPEFRRRKKEQNLLAAYGITLDQRNAIFLSQSNACAICRSETIAGRGWHVDHCHKTEQVRGILCNHCNLMIGHARDNPDVLLAAAEYLKRAKR